MGSDIHAFVEVRKFPYGDKEREKGVWISADKWTVNPDHIFDPINYPKRFHVDSKDAIYSKRDYNLFNILADVRPDGKVEPISSPKGLPMDLSEEVQLEADYWGEDAHSHSYLSLEEFLQYNWDEKVEIHDFVGSKRDAIEKYGEDVECHSLFDSVDLYGPFNDVFVKVTKTRKETMPAFMETIEKLKGFVEESNRTFWQVREEDIRLVLWFDN